MMATPSAPPTWRVVSFTAEPTPALASGSEPMIDSVAGAIVSAMPQAITTIRQAMLRRTAVSADDERHEQQPERRERHAGRDDELGAEALDEPGRQRRDDHHRHGEGQQPHAGLRAASSRARTGGTA